jgi:hypothetical protein
MESTKPQYEKFQCSCGSLSQVIHANRLLENLPAAAISSLMQHHLAVAADQHSSLVQVAAAERKVLTDALERHKAALHPGMLHPNRWALHNQLLHALSSKPVPATETE